MTEFAVLDWTYMRANVSRIDGKAVQAASPFITGAKTTVAHLPPGTHTITVRHNWKEIYLANWGKRTLEMRADLRSGHTYRISEQAHFGRERFQVDFIILDLVDMETVQKVTVVGSENYYDFRRKKHRSCMQGCEDWCVTDWFPDVGYEYFQCLDEVRECKRDCESEWGFLSDLD